MIPGNGFSKECTYKKIVLSNKKKNLKNSLLTFPSASYIHANDLAMDNGPF